MCPLLNIALVMLVAGILGGLVNYFISQSENQSSLSGDKGPLNENQNPLSWWKHIVIGIAASFMVPLFLNMISGDLIDKIQGGDGIGDPDYGKLYVLAGFCLVAAISSRSFISSLSARVLQEVKSANRKADEAKEDAAEAKAVVVDNLIEPEVSEDEADGLSELVASPAPVTDDNELAVLKAMGGSPYPLRSITGISKDSEMTKAVVNTTLSSLIGKGLVSQSLSRGGQPRWFLTQKGRNSYPRA